MKWKNGLPEKTDWYLVVKVYLIGTKFETDPCVEMDYFCCDDKSWKDAGVVKGWMPLPEIPKELFEIEKNEC